jgi:hypothetical protein
MTEEIRHNNLATGCESVPDLIADAGENPIAAYRAYLDDNSFSSGTRKTYRSRIHWFCRWAERLGLDLRLEMRLRSQTLNVPSMSIIAKIDPPDENTERRDKKFPRRIVLSCLAEISLT